MTENTPTDVIRQAIHQQFADRPTLRIVTDQLLADNLKELYPPLTLALSDLRLAVPSGGGGRSLLPLLDVALGYLASRNLPDLTLRQGLDSYLSDATGTRLSYSLDDQPREYDLNAILAVIRELPQLVVIGFQEALGAYWRQDSTAGVSRWQWLGDVLRTGLRSAVVQHAGLTPPQRHMLDAVLDHPVLQARSVLTNADGLVHAYTLETVLTLAGQQVTVQASELLLVHADQVLLCDAAGGIETFTSLNAFGQAWGQRFTERYNAQTLTWNRFEPAGNIFDTQAALLLGQQLDDLAAMVNAPGMNRLALERRYEAITNPVLRLAAAPTLPTPPLDAVNQALPDWLKRADASQRFYYFQHLTQLAGVKQRTQGRQFLDGILDLRSYAADALHTQLQTHPNAPDYRADDLQLTFAVPVGDQGSGYIESVTMSLTDLAVKNLSGKPKGSLTVSHRGNLPVPAWMDQAYIEGLVTQVDIGGRYPQWLNQQLLSGSPAALEREAVFAEQMAVQLPLQALTLWARGESGLTRQGYRYVAALVKPTQAGRTVDEQAIVIRPLAFLRRPGANPDVVADMYLIEPRDTTVGPHILYRAQYAETLREFPTRAALLAAIVAPGPLQDSILTWLPNGARAIYDHGGFHEPHLTHFYNVGAESDPLIKPLPALLDEAQASGELFAALENRQLMPFLYGSYARALIQIGEQTSTSNAESRWAVVMEGSWLVFNTLLLPLLRGPAMLAGWMLQMAPGLLNDIPNLNNPDHSTREIAWVDLLVNLGLVLLHVGVRATTPAPRQAGFEAVALAPLQRTLASPITAPASIGPGIIGMPLEPAGLGRSLIDFKTSSARSASTEQLFQRMQAIRLAWPEGPLTRMEVGPFKGLYRIDGKWRAAVRGRLFPVNIVPGFGEVYALSDAHPDLPGVKLKSDGQGHWSIDEGLRLVGGGPKMRIAEYKKRRQERIAYLTSAYKQFSRAQETVREQVETAEAKHIASHNSTTVSAAQRTTDREAYRTALAQQTSGFVTTLDGIRELAGLEGTVPVPADINKLLHNIIMNTRKEIILADYVRIEINIAYQDLIGDPARRAEAFITQGQRAVDRYFEFLNQTAQNNETMIKAYETVDSRLRELAQAPEGETLHRDLTANRPNEMTALRLKGFQLIILRALCSPESLPELDAALDAAIDPIVLLSRSHVDLGDAQGFSHEERVAVLGNLVQHYANAADGLQSIEVFNEAVLDRDRLAQLLNTVREMAADAQLQLVQALKEAPPAVPTPPRRTGNKRVIKTPSGALVGRTRPRVAEQAGDIVDVMAPDDERTLASYHEHAPDVWVQITQPQMPAPPRVPYAVVILKAQGKKLLDRMQGNLQRIESYVQKASTPKEIQEQLQREAAKFEQLAQDLDSGLTRSAVVRTPKDTQLIQNLSEGAVTLTRKGVQLRTQMALARPPTSDDVEFLLQIGELRAQRETERTALKTGLKDFLQEYTLTTRKNRAYGYAHFHYPAQDTPKAQYSVAHFKTPKQRYDTYASLLAKEQDPGKVIEIHRALITPELANSHFLPMAP